MVSIGGRKLGGGGGPSTWGKPRWNVGELLDPGYASRSKQGDKVYDQNVSEIESLWNERPNRTSLVNPDGSVKDQYRLNAPQKSLADDFSNDYAGNLKASNRGLNQTGMQDQVNYWQNEANRQGLTSSGQALSAAQTNQYNQAQANLTGQNQTALAQGQSALAMRGGLSSGAGERMANKAARTNMEGQMGLASDNMSAQLGITAQDEQMKQSFRDKAFGGSQTLYGLKTDDARYKTDSRMGALQDQRDKEWEASKYNTGVALGDTQAADQWGMDQWMQKGALKGGLAHGASINNQGKVGNFWDNTVGTIPVVGNLTRGKLW